MVKKPLCVFDLSRPSIVDFEAARGHDVEQADWEKAAARVMERSGLEKTGTRTVPTDGQKTLCIESVLKTAPDRHVITCFDPVRRAVIGLDGTAQDIEVFYNTLAEFQ